MRQFVAGEVDVLVSTMIVESGLDVPNANTMFVNRADHFGLAQLYQLRGRVGRSHRRAYCYLLVPDTVDADAERRLAGARAPHRARRRLSHRAQGPRAARRRQPARRRAVGLRAGGRASTCTCGCSTRPCNALMSRRRRAQARAVRRVDRHRRPTCRTTTSPRRTRSSTSTAASRASRRPRRSRRCARSCATGSGRCRRRPNAFLAQALLRVIGGAMGIEGILVRGDEARITFRDDCGAPDEGAFRRRSTRCSSRRRCDARIRSRSSSRASAALRCSTGSFARFAEPRRDA